MHSPWTIEHQDIRVSCSENGKLTITRPVGHEEFDEVEIPAGLVFKMATMLKNTRKVVKVGAIEKAKG